MKQDIIYQKWINSKESLVRVKLIPESDIEEKAIINLELMNPSESERALIDNYFNFELHLGQYSLVSMIKQSGDIFDIHIVNM